MKKILTDCCGWVALTGEAPTFAPLQGDQKADWVVIGGGFTGLAAARRIAQTDAGARIVLLDGKRIGQGASGRNSGFVVAHESPGHAALSTPGGRADYSALSALDLAGVRALGDLVHHHEIDCQWEDTGSIHAAANPRNFAKIRNHAQVFADLGIEAKVLDEAALKTRLGTGFYGLGVEVRGGALIQPAMLARGLLDSLPQQVEVFEQTIVQSVEIDGASVTVNCNGGSLRAARVIVAVNAFLPRLGFYADRVFGVALTASLTRVLTTGEEAEIGHAKSWGILSPRSMGATLRLTRDRRLMIRNTGEYDPSGISGSTLARRRDVHRRGLRKRFPWLEREAIEYTWSGNICISRNSKPVFASIDDKVYISGCYNASGVARGSIMGWLIVDHALREPSALLDKALSIQTPAKIPPRPFFDIGARARITFERWRARGEE